ncbi:MAG: hypothetical protein HY814_01850 [Candidatus Riflebacteria bacterium]|nr:hypothetical protein [Candidatus Riflebacteria bacterium]
MLLPSLGGLSALVARAATHPLGPVRIAEGRSALTTCRKLLRDPRWRGRLVSLLPAHLRASAAGGLSERWLCRLAALVALESSLPAQFFRAHEVAVARLAWTLSCIVADAHRTALTSLTAPGSVLSAVTQEILRELLEAGPRIPLDLEDLMARYSGASCAAVRCSEALSGLLRQSPLANDPWLEHWGGPILMGEVLPSLISRKVGYRPPPWPSPKHRSSNAGLAEVTRLISLASPEPPHPAAERAFEALLEAAVACLVSHWPARPCACSRFLLEGSKYVSGALDHLTLSLAARPQLAREYARGEAPLLAELRQLTKSVSGRVPQLSGQLSSLPPGSSHRSGSPRLHDRLFAVAASFRSACGKPGELLASSWRLAEALRQLRGPLKGAESGLLVLLTWVRLVAGEEIRGRSVLREPRTLEKHLLEVARDWAKATGVLDVVAVLGDSLQLAAAFSSAGTRGDLRRLARKAPELLSSLLAQPRPPAVQAVQYLVGRSGRFSGDFCEHAVESYLAAIVEAKLLVPFLEEQLERLSSFRPRRFGSRELLRWALAFPRLVRPVVDHFNADVKNEALRNHVALAHLMGRWLGLGFAGFDRIVADWSARWRPRFEADPAVRKGFLAAILDWAVALGTCSSRARVADTRSLTPIEAELAVRPIQDLLVGLVKRTCADATPEVLTRLDALLLGTVKTKYASSAEFLTELPVGRLHRSAGLVRLLESAFDILAPSERPSPARIRHHVRTWVGDRLSQRRTVRRSRLRRRPHPGTAGPAPDGQSEVATCSWPT